MPIFVVKRVDKPDIRQPICKLIRDDKCLIEEFFDRIKDDNNLKGQLKILWATIEDVAKGELVPKTRYRPLGDDAYEVKSSNLRLYLTRLDGAIILVIGGKKDEQKEDIRRAKKIIKEFITYKK